MKRLEELFKNKPTGVLNVYCTAGYPLLDSTIPVMEAIQAGGADLIEIGMPYSDPLADGPIIQSSSTVAIQNGMTLDFLFHQLKGFRETIHVPVVLMGYMNPVLQYGFEKFCKKAVEVGIDGLVLPDLPVYEFETKYAPIIHQYNLDFIFLVTPETNESRVRLLDKHSSGFLYAVSSSSTTGNENDFEKVISYLSRLKSYGLKNPCLVGFGIKDKMTFDIVQPYANGAIIGSAFIKAISDTDHPEQSAIAFVQKVLN